MSGMIWAVTGHRPPRLGGYSDEARRRLVLFAIETLGELLKDDERMSVISGMAQGWDQAIAEAAVHLNIPFTAAIPFVGQEKRWPEPARRRYESLVAKAKHIHFVRNRHHPNVFFERNKWMVMESGSVLVLMDPDVKEGGTRHCHDYALRWSKPTLNVWSRWLEFQERG